MEVISDKILIALYKSTTGDLELSKITGIPERTLQRRLANLRNKGKIPYRKDLPSSKTVSSRNAYSEIIKPINWAMTNRRHVHKIS